MKKLIRPTEDNFDHVSYKCFKFSNEIIDAYLTYDDSLNLKKSLRK